jgi:adenosylcobinamide-GDP ribazoletransferase
MPGALLAAILLELRCAVGLLTRLPVAGTRASRTGSAAFAVVGGALGALAATAALVVGEERGLLAAAVALAVLALASGVLHLDGLADIADALAAPDASATERARRDPAIGAAGAAAIALLLLVQAAALATLPTREVLPGLVVAGAASRAVPAVAAPWAARADRGFGAWFASHSGRGGAAVALGTSLAIALLAPGLPSPVGWLAGLSTGLALLALIAHRLGSVSGDGYGAAVEVAFASSLVALSVAR